MSPMRYADGIGSSAKTSTSKCIWRLAPPDIWPGAGSWSRRADSVRYPRRIFELEIAGLPRVLSGRFGCVWVTPSPKAEPTSRPASHTRLTALKCEDGLKPWCEEGLRQSCFVLLALRFRLGEAHNLFPSFTRELDNKPSVIASIDAVEDS